MFTLVEFGKHECAACSGVVRLSSSRWINCFNILSPCPNSREYERLIKFNEVPLSIGFPICI